MSEIDPLAAVAHLKAPWPIDDARAVAYFQGIDAAVAAMQPDSIVRSNDE